MKKYEPYNLEPFTRLLAWAYNKGWYSGRRELLTIRILGDFEGWSGRATETWETHFIVSNCEIPDIHIQAHTAEGETLYEACSKLEQMLIAESIKNKERER